MPAIKLIRVSAVNNDKVHDQLVVGITQEICHSIIGDTLQVLVSAVDQGQTVLPAEVSNQVRTHLISFQC